MSGLLDELTEAIIGLDDDGKAKIVEQVSVYRTKQRFFPLPGPQTDAFLSEADILLYGGAAGGGKTFLLMGLASEKHRRSIIFRRELSQTDGLAEAGKQIIGTQANYVGSPLPEWTYPDGRTIKLAGLKEPGDWIKHAGRERDLIGFDEAGEFVVEQVSSLLAWNRGPEGQRCRVILASNPPRTSDGYWMTEWFAPWIDGQYPDPASPGELRWAILVDNVPTWVDGPEMVHVDGEPFKPISFTFIPALLKDNPFRDTPEYRAKLNSLPEPLRSQLLYGAWDAGMEDDQWQVIPTHWVREAMQRWREQPPLDVPQCALGVDVAQGGKDHTVIAARFDGWFAPLVTEPGSNTPGGTDVAGLVVKHRRDQSKVIIDVGGGWGADAYAHLKANGVEVDSHMGVKKSAQREKNNQLGFRNVRTQTIWRFREALDPDQEGGSPIALPYDKQLLADLTSWRFTTKSGEIACESKEELVKRLGRSTDRGDAVVMAWSSGAKMVSDWQKWAERRHRGRGVRVVTKAPRR